MTTTAAIFGGFSITLILACVCMLGVVLKWAIEDFPRPTRTQILYTLAFLATWAVIAGLLRWVW